MAEQFGAGAQGVLKVIESWGPGFADDVWLATQLIRDPKLHYLKLFPVMGLAAVGWIMKQEGPIRNDAPMGRFDNIFMAGVAFWAIAVKGTEFFAPPKKRGELRVQRMRERVEEEEQVRRARGDTVGGKKKEVEKKEEKPTEDTNTIRE